MGEETPAIIIHNFAQAQVALAAAHEANKPVALWSAPGAGCYAGAGWWRGLLDLLRQMQPDQDRYITVLDCSDAPGFVMAAIRAQVPGIYFRGLPDITQKLSEMATAQGLGLVKVRPAALDLAAPKNPYDLCLHYLRGDQPHGLA